MPRSEFWYVYGVTPAATDLSRAPLGIEDASLEACIDGELAAIGSRVDGEQYAPNVIEQGTAEVEWLAPRAVAHDRVLTWLSDRGPVLPLPIFSLFSSRDAVRQMLRDRREDLMDALGRVAKGREYALRVYRIDPELSAIAIELSPRLSELQQAALSATPGQRYLLERKLETEKRNELHAIGTRVGREIFGALASFALQSVETRISSRAGRTGAEGTLILDAAFLVTPPQLENFKRALTKLVEEHGARGFRFDFTGPWPPYHFVQHSAVNA